MVGTSDTHVLWQLDTTYSLIDAKPNIQDIFKAIKNDKVIIKTQPLSNIKYFDFLMLNGPVIVVRGKSRQYWRALRQKVLNILI